MTELAAEVLASMSTPDHVDSRLGPLEFTDGAPSREDGRDAVRPSRLLPRRERVPDGVPGGVDAGDPRGVPRHRREGQRGADLLGADGLVVAVPDRERRHRLLHLLRRPVRRPDGGRDAADGAGHLRRHVVPVDHRLRPARARPWGGREVPARASRLRRPAARGRLLRRALAHATGCSCSAGRSCRTTIPRRPSRRSSRRSRSTRTRRAARAPASPRCSRARAALAPPADVPETTFVEGTGLDVQHDPAERRRVLRDRARAAPGRAGRRRRPRDHRPPRRARHRQGQAVRARRAHAQDPRRSRHGRQRHLAGADVRRPRRGGRRPTTRTRRGPTCCSAAATCSIDRSRRSRRRASSRTRRPAPASTTCARCSSTATPGITPAMAMRLTGIGSQYLVRVHGLEQGVLRRREVVHA